MGAIFFYIFIYFVGYYASNILNMLTVRPLVTNRYMAALLPVYGVALTHAYVIVSSPPPQGTDMTVEYALGVFIALPVVVVTMGAAYFMWNSKGKDDDPVGAGTATGNKDSDDNPLAVNRESVDADTGAIAAKQTGPEDNEASVKDTHIQENSDEVKNADISKRKDA